MINNKPVIELVSKENQDILFTFNPSVEFKTHKNLLDFVSRIKEDIKDNSDLRIRITY